MDTQSPHAIAQDGTDRTPETEEFARVYEELRRIARSRLRQEAPGHTLQTTALVHEAYLRLGTQSAWESRAHFFGTAARAMRQVLVDHARRRGSVKRGGGAQRVPLHDVHSAPESDFDRIQTLNTLVDRLASIDARKAEIASFALFLDMTHAQIAEVLALSVRSVEREWRFIKAWLHSEYSQTGESSREHVPH